MFECTTSIEHCKGMLFCDKYQTFEQLFSDFNVMLTLSPYYIKARVLVIKEKGCFSKKQRHRKAFTFRCLDALREFEFEAHFRDGYDIDVFICNKYLAQLRNVVVETGVGVIAVWPKFVLQFLSGDRFALMRQ